MPGRGDLAHQLGMVVGHPAEDEEGGARAVVLATNAIRTLTAVQRAA